MSLFTLSLTVTLLLLASDGIRAEELPVNLVQAESRIISNPVRTTGRLVSRSEQTLSFRVAGLIGTVQVQDGEGVSAGQELARLNAEEIDAEVTQAQARLAEAQRAEQRLEKLYTSRVIPLDQLQTAQTAVEVSQARLQAALFSQRHSRITAPADGRILKRYVEPNELASPQQPAFRFSASDSEWVMQLGLNDRDVVRVQVGDQAEIRLAAYPGQTFVARLAEIAATATLRTGTYAAEVALQDIPPGIRLFSGMIGEVRIQPGAAQERILLPLSALIAADGSHAQVYVVDDARQIAVRDLQISRFDSAYVHVVAGLQEGEWVVAEGATRLSLGDQIVEGHSVVQGR